jgi:Pilus assembly protein, PilP
MRSVNTLVVGILLAIGAPALYAQTSGATGSGAQGASPTAAKSQARPAKRASGKGKAKAAAAAPKAPAAAVPAKSEAASAEGGDAQAGGEGKLARRDPFESLISRQESGPAKNLPPGKAGLQVSTLRLDGIVKSSNGMIAVVSNPQSRTYFLREGDQLYDGRVEKIAMDGVAFHEIGKDAFGKPVERQVNKRIYASAGEQQ